MDVFLLDPRWRDAVGNDLREDVCEREHLVPRLGVVVLLRARPHGQRRHRLRAEQTDDARTAGASAHGGAADPGGVRVLRRMLHRLDTSHRSAATTVLLFESLHDAAGRDTVQEDRVVLLRRRS